MQIYSNLPPVNHLSNRVLIIKSSQQNWWYDNRIGEFVDIELTKMRGSDSYYLADTDWNRKVFAKWDYDFSGTYFIMRNHFVYGNTLDNESALPALQSMEDYISG